MIQNLQVCKLSVNTPLWRGRCRLHQSIYRWDDSPKVNPIVERRFMGRQMANSMPTIPNRRRWRWSFQSSPTHRSGQQWRSCLTPLTWTYMEPARLAGHRREHRSPSASVLAGIPRAGDANNGTCQSPRCQQLSKYTTILATSFGVAFENENRFLPGYCGLRLLFVPRKWIIGCGNWTMVAV